MGTVSSNVYDVVIVGAGVTGLAAGMYAGRLGLKTVVFGHNSGTEFPIGGVITTTDVVENYPGFIRLTGEELAKNIENHAREYNIDIRQEKVTTINRNGNCFTAVTEKGETFTARTVIYAAGTIWRKLPMPGAKELENRGVSYCALCDGPLYRNKIVAIIGGSDSAAKEAITLAEHAAHVYIIARGEKLRAEPVNAALLEKNPKITVLTQTNVTQIVGTTVVEKVILDRPHNGQIELVVQGVFGAIGHLALSDVAVAAGITVNEKKEIIINRNSETNIPGFFAAGDVVDTAFKQAIVGVAEGVVAAYHAFKFVKENEIICPTNDESI